MDPPPNRNIETVPFEVFERLSQHEEHLARRLEAVRQAFEQAAIPYAVIGGFAVATWVASVDPAAARGTVDLDILLERSDLDRAAGAPRTLCCFCGGSVRL